MPSLHPILYASSSLCLVSSGGLGERTWAPDAHPGGSPEVSLALGVAPLLSALLSVLGSALPLP